MSTTMNKNDIYAVYEEVRSDSTDTNWAVFKFNGPEIVLDSTGTDYAEFKSKFSDDERLFGYVRIYTGDELSRRAKFVLVAWVGPNVGALKKAKMSTDKAVIKEVIQNFAIELMPHEAHELDEEELREACIKAGGANYGTGVRG
ncbi:coactosin-like protein [Lingula anatina]|uniref:Coactosin-like protein n=1 Tax=Lingula anatina TaxID=7574 RepID=A0A1S3I2P2_LINAN|nr:coactosin-like protein [Lingula anatina]|eukprot:XP_013392513.1 coactosin-like protein [Lingula anatina]